MPKVSVIVTTYNRKEYLTETIQSILNQTYQDFELIVVDNFSNYDFFAHINNFNNTKIIPFQNQNNGIIAVNRNFGIKQSQSEFIAFCDDDDLWFPNKLKVQVSILLDNPQISLIAGNTITFSDNDTNKVLTKKKHKTCYNISLYNLIRINPINLSTVLIRKNILKDSIFPEDYSLLAVEDYSLWLQLKTKGYILSVINDDLVYYRNNAHSQFALFNNNINLKINLVYWKMIIDNKTTNLKVIYMILMLNILNVLKYSIKRILAVTKSISVV
jgi:glycosyltransferase involved in cell wall biosynthesis